MSADVDLTLERIVNPNALIRKLALRDNTGNSRYIAGYANISGIIDSQNEVVTHEALKSAWAKWRANPEYALLNLLHQNLPMAKVVFEPVIDSNGNTHLSGVDEKGLYIVGLVRDDVTIADEVWQKIERGEYRGFSIGGRNLNPQLPDCSSGTCIRQIDKLELYEVSIVDQPANRASLFNMLKRDDLAVLAEVTNKFTEQIVTAGVVKISKKRGETCGKYHVIIESDLVAPMTFETEDTRVVEEAAEGMEYVTLFDHALLRPFGALTGEVAHGGVNPLPLTAEEPNTPKNEGDNPLSEKEGEIETKHEETLETPETPEEEIVKEPEEAIAPLTMESLAADLARIADRLDTLEKAGEPAAVEETPAVDAVIQVAQEAAAVPEAEVPVVTKPTETVLEPARTLPPVEETPAPVVETPQPAIVPPAEVLVDTRGVAVQATTALEGVVPIAAIYGMSWDDIHNIVE